jgi:hypothetical protein|tara:strand:+ start:54 stop:263 length:210 start_codon:yes stop_codon:yes gene_type:complete
MNLTNQLVGLMSSKTLVLNHTVLITVVVAHNSWWIASNLLSLLSFSSSWSKSIFHGLHLGVVVEVEALS